jgi:hypothetical protein
MLKLTTNLLISCQPMLKLTTNLLISCQPMLKLTTNLLISCQPMLKLTTQYGFHVLFRVSYVQILVTVTQSVTNVAQTNNTSTSGMNEE